MVSVEARGWGGVGLEFGSVLRLGLGLGSGLGLWSVLWPQLAMAAPSNGGP